MAFGAVAAWAVPLIVETVANWYQNRRQEKMANKVNSTAYQRMVRDMAQAGLNPMLAYQQGHGESSQLPQTKNPLEGLTTKALEAQLVKAQIKTNLTQQNLNRAVESKTYADREKSMSEAASTKWDLTKDQAVWTYGKDLILRRYYYEFEKLMEEWKQAKTETERQHLELEIRKVESKLISLTVPGAQFEAGRGEYLRDLKSPDWMKYIGGYLLKGGASAAGIYRDTRDNRR